MTEERIWTNAINADGLAIGTCRSCGVNTEGGRSCYDHAVTDFGEPVRLQRYVTSSDVRASPSLVDQTTRAGRQRRATCHSSCCSARTAPTSNGTAAQLGKMPTTLVRRLFSLLRHSCFMPVSLEATNNAPFRGRAFEHRRAGSSGRRICLSGLPHH